VNQERLRLTALEDMKQTKHGLRTRELNFYAVGTFRVSPKTILKINCQTLGTIIVTTRSRHDPLNIKH